MSQNNHIERLARYYFYHYSMMRFPFYRKYPYHNMIAPSQTDSRGVVDQELKFFYNRIPKAANSTIMLTLAANKFSNESLDEKTAKKLFTLSPKKLNPEQVKNFDTFYKFTFVRNPYTRILSTYLDKVVHEKRLNEDLNKEKPTFNDFLDYLDRGDYI